MFMQCVWAAYMSECSVCGGHFRCSMLRCMRHMQYVGACDMYISHVFEIWSEYVKCGTGCLRFVLFGIGVHTHAMYLSCDVCPLYMVCVFRSCTCVLFVCMTVSRTFEVALRENDSAPWSAAPRSDP